VLRNVADFWASRASWNADKKRYEIVHVTSVAESYNDVPNDTFTNVSAQKALIVAATAAALVGERADPHWAEVAAKLYIPFSEIEQRHLDFDAGVPREPLEGSTLGLLLYPSLDFAMTPQIRRNDFNYTMISVKEGHHEPHGMGMAPASIAAAAVGDAPLAVAWLQNNFTSNLIKPPFNVRTETASNNSGYFITSSGGFVQNLLYGFTGLRIQEKGLVGAYAPVLPPDWKSMTLKDIVFRGQRYDITIDRDASGRAKLTRKSL
jgi:trehalose/maltose hydrolase-like predicted phosphorylase